MIQLNAASLSAGRMILGSSALDQIREKITVIKDGVGKLFKR